MYYIHHDPDLEKIKHSFNPSMVTEEGGGDSNPPKNFSSQRFSREWGELLFQTEFLAVGGICQWKNFQIGVTFLALELGKGRVLKVCRNQPSPTE